MSSVNQDNDNKIKILRHPLLIKSYLVIKLIYSNMVLCISVIAFIPLLLTTTSTTNCSL